MLFAYALLLVATSCSTLAKAGDLDTPLESWRGEYLQQAYGGIYTSMKAQGFQKSQRGRSITSNVFVHLREKKQGRRYVLGQPLVDTAGQPPVWKIPAGEYEVSRISLNDHTGRTRVWLSQGRPTFVVRHLFLSNLGLMSFQPEGARGLRVSFQPQPNTFQNPYDHHAFAGVIDAYSLTVQEQLGGKELFRSAEQSFGSSVEARAAITHQRQISMVYQVDLEAPQPITQRVVNTVAAQDTDLRRCYTDELERSSSDLQGQIGFRFQISSNSGAIQKMSPQTDTIKSPRLAKCLALTLGRMQFPITKTLKGTIRFQFSYKDDTGRSIPP